MNNLTEAGYAWENNRLNAYLKDQDDYDRLQQYEQGIVDRATGMLAQDASESDRRDVFNVIAKASGSYCYAHAVTALLYARPLLAGLHVSPAARLEVQALLDAAEEAEKDARHDLENAIREVKV